MCDGRTSGRTDRHRTNKWVNIWGALQNKRIKLPGNWIPHHSYYFCFRVKVVNIIRVGVEWLCAVPELR